MTGDYEQPHATYLTVSELGQAITGMMIANENGITHSQTLVAKLTLIYLSRGGDTAKIG